jgi:precorrin isomerase
VLVDCRGLESALEAVRVSVEAVRVSIEALRCLRGCERLEEVPENVSRGRESVAEAKKVPVDLEVVREPVRKSVLKNSGTHQNVLVLFQSF